MTIVAIDQNPSRCRVLAAKLPFAKRTITSLLRG